MERLKVKISLYINTPEDAATYTTEIIDPVSSTVPP
jgi:hypothetical protein